jgi:hypothetical protein
VRIKADTGNFRSGVVYSNDVYTTINTGISDFKRTNITLYPNPVSNIIIIDKLTENTEVSIYSLNGVLVKAVYLNNTNKIAVNDLPNGIYILKLQGNKIKGETKFIKQ